jgi:hypothetical protein
MLRIYYNFVRMPRCNKFATCTELAAAASLLYNAYPEHAVNAVQLFKNLIIG